MGARIVTFVYGVISYLTFLVSFVYAIGFVGDVLVPKSIDRGGSADLTEAVFADLTLLGLFAVQHSVMARPGFKHWWVRIIPAAAERSTYVLLSSLILMLLFWQWRPIPAPVWQLASTAMGPVLTGIFWLGWLTVLLSTFLINHFDLFGLRQAAAKLRGTDMPSTVFKMPLLYKIVRHPIMLGFLFAFWATPNMSAGHLLFAVMTTGYILIALQLEERDLIATFGASYEQYRQRVPMIVPLWPTGRGEPDRASKHLRPSA